MITWNNFHLFAIVSIVLWLIGATFALRSSKRSRAAIGLTSAGVLVLGVFIVGLWMFLQRPPLRTMGETRLWYSFFMGIAGLLTYIRWKYRWILSFSTLLSTVFVIINLLKPEIHDQSLMHGSFPMSRFICFHIQYWDAPLLLQFAVCCVIEKSIW